MAVISVLSNFSTWPLARGWYVVLNKFLVPKNLQTLWKTIAMHLGHFSDGTRPVEENTVLYGAIATDIAVILFIATALTILEHLQDITKIKWLPRGVRINLPRISIAPNSKEGCAGKTFSGLNFSVALCGSWRT